MFDLLLAVFQGKVLRNGSIWGEDMILQSDSLRRAYSASAMTYLEVFSLARERLLAVACSFPITRKHLRKCAIKLALRREVVKAAHAMRQVKSTRVVQGVRNWGRKGSASAALLRASMNESMAAPMPTFEQYYQGVDRTSCGESSASQAADRRSRRFSQSSALSESSGSALLGEFRSITQRLEERMDSKMAALDSKLETLLSRVGEYPVFRDVS
mmetsp:Transcript_70796/g.212995  ORF Transcript_70796/g.212995 Transcript_70796/m.212995 type:complete len:214 (-) Transcript_70796:14-655(-)